MDSKKDLLQSISEFLGETTTAGVTTTANTAPYVKPLSTRIDKFIGNSDGEEEAEPNVLSRRF